MKTAGVIVAVVLALAGCAETGPGGPASREIFHDVFWTASRQCEQRYRNLRVERIGSDGNLSLASDLDLVSNLEAFTQCYHDAIRERIEARRRAGGTVPEGLNLKPSVDID